jgi:hypothetical protein
LEIRGFPPKIVLLKTGNNSSKALAELLINIKPMIEDLENNNYGLLEIETYGFLYQACQNVIYSKPLCEIKT